MDVWANKDKFLKDELLKSNEVMNYITPKELEAIFNSDKILKNVDYIFQRSIYSED
jgi:adenylosuccinate lyase